jgi:DNA-binding transcriptional LysR family regulator
MDFRQFRYFIVTAEELHVARAAERLGIAQPALSQMIRGIEERVGARLFHRAHRRITLTAAGVAFLAEARLAVEHAEMAAKAAQRASRGETGRVRIGYVSSALLEETFLNALALYQQKNPDVVVDLVLRNTVGHIAAMRSEDQDVAVARGPAPGVPDGFEVRPFSRWPLVVAVPARHPLAERRTLSLDDLQDETLLMPDDPPGSGLAHTVAQTLAQHGFLPHRVIRVTEVTAWVGLVGAGLGVALLPASARALQMNSVSYRPLKGVQAQSELLVISRRGETAPAVRAFLERLWKAAPAAKADAR